MSLQQALTKFGLTDNETKVYLACLEIGSSTVLQIAKKSGLSRSTVYSVLEALILKAVVTEFEQRNVKHYKVEDPQVILNSAKQTYDSLKNVFPELKELQQAAKNQPRISYYQGETAVKKMYENILKEKGLKEYLIIASEKDWLSMGKDFFEEFKLNRAKANIKTRLILEDSLEARKRKTKSHQTFSEVKLLPAEFFYKFTSGIYIFKNKVIFTSYTKDIVSVVIENKNIAALHKAMFEFMWNGLQF